jgi:uncharacterized protein YjbI with pentapeptide repeats
MATTESTSKRGREFELTVAELFKSAGYETQHNTTIAGQQVDILATKVGEFSIVLRVVVECKWFSSTSRSVANQDVYDFISFIKAAKESQNITHGVMVTNTDFSKSAQQAAQSTGFVLLRRAYELEDELIGLRILFSQLCARYRRSDIHSLFVPIEVRPITNNSGRHDLMKLLLPHLHNHSPSINFLLGDFGRGKTTAAEKLFFELADSYLKGNIERAPFLFKLRYFSDSHTLNHFINAQIEQSLQSKFDLEKFWYLEKTKRAIIILDGFDEIATHATELRRTQYFHDLIPLITSSNHVVITSRPSYFRTLTEFNSILEDVNRLFFEQTSLASSDPTRRDKNAKKLADSHAEMIRQRILGGNIETIPEKQAEIYEILPLSQETVIQYISKYEKQIKQVYKCSPLLLYESISKLYDLRDLLTTPLLLDMMLYVLIRKPLDLTDQNLSVGPAALYRNYVSAHLDRDWEKGQVRQYLTQQERLDFARGMALAMLHSDNLEVDFSTIVDTIQRTAKEFSETRRAFIERHMEEVSSDVLICSFLTLNMNDLFEFVHKSFMEYFVADYIQSRLPERKKIRELAANLNFETLFFLGGFCFIEARLSIALRYQLSQFGGPRSGLYRRNIIAAMLYSRQTTRGEKLHSCRLDYLRFRKITFADCTLEDFSFFRCSFEDILISESALENLALDECQLQGLRILNSSGRISIGDFVSGLSVSACASLSCTVKGDVRNIEIKESTIDILGDRVDIVGGSASEFSVRFVVKPGSIMRLRDISFSNGDLIVGGSADARPPESMFSYLLKTNFDKFSVQLEECEFHNVNFVFVKFDFAKLLLAIKHGRLKDCKGVIIVNRPDYSSEYFETEEHKEGSTVRIRHTVGVYEQVLLLPNVDKTLQHVATRFIDRVKSNPKGYLKEICESHRWMRDELGVDGNSAGI